MESIDPRIARLKNKDSWEEDYIKENMDQMETYEVFLRLRENKPFEHVGAMHAPNREMALIFAKEQYSRRYTCTGIFIVSTACVQITGFTDNQQSIYDNIHGIPEEEDSINYEIFHLKKRGKQHVHMGRVTAGSYEEAVFEAKAAFDEGAPVYNVWVVKSDDILATTEEDLEIWATLPEKKFREAIDYKAADKIKQFKEEFKDDKGK